MNEGARFPANFILSFHNFFVFVHYYGSNNGFQFFSLKFEENLDLCDHFYAFSVDIFFLFGVLMTKPMMFLAATCMINPLTLVCSHGLC